MKKVKILHTDPISLSNFINKNYYSIEKWWNNEKTQKAREHILNLDKIVKETGIDKQLDVVFGGDKPGTGGKVRNF